MEKMTKSMITTKKRGQLPKQYNNRQVAMATTDKYDEPYDKIIDDEISDSEEIGNFEENNNDDDDKNQEVNIADHVARANAMTRKINMCREIKTPSSSRWISKAKRVDCGVGLVDGGADTIVCGSGWLQQSTTLQTANIQGFSDDMQKKKIPIGTSLAATTTNTGDTVILQVNKALQIPEN